MDEIDQIYPTKETDEDKVDGYEEAFEDSKLIDDTLSIKSDVEKSVFSVGSVVPAEKPRDVFDKETVLIHNVDTYIGKYIGEYLSDKIIGKIEESYEEDSESEYEEEEEEEESVSTSVTSVRSGKVKGKNNWKILGTFSNKKSKIPKFLWATMKTENHEAYIKEALKCGAIIYDITQDPSEDKINQVKALVDALRDQVAEFKTNRIFILISSLHSWSQTSSKDFDEESFPFTEDDYRVRKTSPTYRQFQLLERYVVAAGKMTHGMLKSYVIGAGAVYGQEQFTFHHWFKSAWHNARFLPIFGTGKNIIPAVHITNLAAIVHNVLELCPKKQRYLIAVDPVLCTQEQIVKAISISIGTGRVSIVPQEEIYLNKNITTFQADQILLDLNIEAKYCKENFYIEWVAERGGFIGSIEKLDLEFRNSRNLSPIKIVITGPPASGKTTLARHLADLYRLHHFTKIDMITTTQELLKEVVGEELDDGEVDPKVEEAIASAKALLAPVNKWEMENNDPLPQELFIKLCRWRLFSSDCLNQGWILDGFPESYHEAEAIFSPKEDSKYISGEDENIDPRMRPDKVFILEATDGIIKENMKNIPKDELNERHHEKNLLVSLKNYRINFYDDYKNSFLRYLDEREILYFPISVEFSDSQTMIQSTLLIITSSIGKPHNYSLKKEEEEALKNALQYENQGEDQVDSENLAKLEGIELDERRKKIQNWMENLAQVKGEEFEREEAAQMPIRNYLMANIIPTLTKGLLDVTRARPDDPIDYLAEYLFQNNPGNNPACDSFM